MGVVTTMTTTKEAPALQSTPSSIHLPSESSTSAKLRTNYQTAANAFLRREFSLTNELVQEALDLLPLPSSVDASADIFAQQRRKWSILRNTLVTTVHGLPAKEVPQSLREDAALPAPALLNSLTANSARLFTPALFQPSTGWLPAQIVHTLVMAALKLGIPQVGRDIVEEWLVRRTPGSQGEGKDGYDKLLELYCVHVLPRLDDWDYAREFLEYETELPVDRREAIKADITLAHEQYLSAKVSTPMPGPSSSTDASQFTTPTTIREPDSSRSPSPARSTTSSASTQTARPIRRDIPALTPLSSTPSTSSTVTATPRGRAPVLGSRRQKARPPQTTISERSSEHSLSSFPSPPHADPIPPTEIQAPTSFALVYDTILQRVSGFICLMRDSPPAALAAILVLVPMISFLLRIHRTRRTAAARNPTLHPISGGPVGNLWRELLRVVTDTVSMAGRGLV